MEDKFARGWLPGLNTGERLEGGSALCPAALRGLAALLVLLPVRVEAEPLRANSVSSTTGGVVDTAPSGSAAENASLEEARRLFGEATTLYSEQRYADALVLFQRVHELSGEPEVLFNVAQCLRLTMRCSEARDAFERYLSAAPRVAVDSQSWLLELEQKCSVPATGTLPMAPVEGGQTSAAATDALPVVSREKGRAPAERGQHASNWVDGRGEPARKKEDSAPREVYESVGAGMLGLAALSAIGSGVFVWLARDSEEKYEQLEASPRANEVDWSQLGAEARSQGERREVVAASLAVSAVVIGGVGALLFGSRSDRSEPSSPPSEGLQPVRVGLGWTPGFVSVVGGGEF